MLDLARPLAFGSALLMVISFAIWASWLEGPPLQRLDGQRTSNVEPAALALKLLMVSLGLSAVAAVLAVVHWMSP